MAGSKLKFSFVVLTLILFSSCGGGSSSEESGSINTNSPPSFSVMVSEWTIPENQTEVLTVEATDPDGDTLTYSIGGEDASIFSVIYGVIMTESFNFSNNDILMGFFLGVPQLAFGFICITIGSRTVESATVGLLMLMETLCAPLWVWLFLNEIPPLSVFLGGAIIIFAIILKSFDKAKLKA